jgi:uncharacterized damage-inducible protein DinB
MDTISTDLRYPTGKYETRPYSEQQKNEWINDIKFLPQLLENAIVNLDEAQLLTAYREDGWTVQQVVHHVADSHMNAYCRFKIGLTEEHPTIRPYDQAAWARLSDSANIPVNISLTLLYALHTRWHSLLSDLPLSAWERIVVHPEQKKEMTLWYLLGSYAWHGKHHVAHITSLRERNKW